METDLLFDALARHPIGSAYDATLFRPVVEHVNTDTARFHIPLPNVRQPIKEGEDYLELSLRRVLVTENIDRRTTPLGRRLRECIRPPVYSSSVLARGLRRDDALRPLLMRTPYALLGKAQESFELEDETGHSFYQVTRPLLFIPGAERDEQVLKWEHQHTLLMKEGSRWSRPSSLLISQFFPVHDQSVLGYSRLGG